MWRETDKRPRSSALAPRTPAGIDGHAANMWRCTSASMRWCVSSGIGGRSAGVWRRRTPSDVRQASAGAPRMFAGAQDASANIWRRASAGARRACGGKRRRAFCTLGGRVAATDPSHALCAGAMYRACLSAMALLGGSGADFAEKGFEMAAKGRYGNAASAAAPCRVRATCAFFGERPATTVRWPDSLAISTLGSHFYGRSGKSQAGRPLRYHAGMISRMPSYDSYTTLACCKLCEICLLPNGTAQATEPMALLAQYRASNVQNSSGGRPGAKPRRKAKGRGRAGTRAFPHPTETMRLQVPCSGHVSRGWVMSAGLPAFACESFICRRFRCPALRWASRIRMRKVHLVAF